MMVTESGGKLATQMRLREKLERRAIPSLVFPVPAQLNPFSGNGCFASAGQNTATPRRGMDDTDISCKLRSYPVLAVCYN